MAHDGALDAAQRVPSATMRPIPPLALAAVVAIAGAARAGESLPSCEEAAAGYVDDVGARGGSRDLTSRDYGQVLNTGSYLGPCNVPEEMTLKICAAVQSGKAAGVTVTTDPVDGDVAECVRAQVAALEFPSNPKMDIARTTFAPPEKDHPPPLRFSETPTNAGPPPVEPKKSGCGCVVVGAPSGTAWLGPLVFALAGAAFARRGGRAQSPRTR